MEKPSSMDFFGAQDNARKKTVLLVGYFIAAVAAIIIGIYCIIAGALIYNKQVYTFFIPELFFSVIGATLLIVLAGSLYKTYSLRTGGKAVAAMMGARLVDPASTDLREKRLLNVVEEMAIASGLAVPGVYILDEEGINAFAAGFTQDDAIVCVTRGCLEHLTRDELQGVIAHEFSHILNSDMRLNIKLMGVLHGILVISIIGYYVFRATANSGRSSRLGSSRSGKKGNSAGLPLILIGLGVMVIGYIGVFFGNLIKAAVSRNREFLADASSVQFTRNPGGIAGALKKIGGFSKGSRITDMHAAEASHFFFSSSVALPFLNLMATHPPLTERVRRIEPGFSGTFSQDAAESVVPVSADEFGTSSFAGKEPAQRGAHKKATTGDQIMQSVGRPTHQHLAYATKLLAALPPQIRASLAQPSGARAVLYGLLLHHIPEILQKQMAMIKTDADPSDSKLLEQLVSTLVNVPRAYRIELADLALFALQNISKPDFERLSAVVNTLILADNEVSLFELALEQMIMRRLRAKFTPRHKQRPVYQKELPAANAVQVLLSSLAWSGTGDHDQALPAITAGIKELPFAVPVQLHPREQCTVGAVKNALTDLYSVSPQNKKALLRACLTTISADDSITTDEAELVRAVADSLDCPIPPVIPDTTI